jgi:hypothetical protein
MGLCFIEGMEFDGLSRRVSPVGVIGWQSVFVWNNWDLYFVLN